VVCLISTIFSPVASGTQRVCVNHTRHLSPPLASGKFSNKHQNSGPNVDKLNKSKLGGPAAGEFPANIFEPGKISEKSLSRKQQQKTAETSGPQTDGGERFRP